MHGMRTTLSHRKGLTLAAFVGVLLIGGLSVVGSRNFVDTEERTPRIDGVINGIRVGPSATPSGILCQPGQAKYADPSLAVGTRLEISPAYLPSGTFFDPEAAELTECGRTLVGHGKTYSIEPDENVGRSGGTLMIGRVVGSHDVPLSLSDRARPATVAGRPAIVDVPFTPDGHGPSAHRIEHVHDGR